MPASAPIGITTYVRLGHLREAISALKKNLLAKHSDLYIFSDAPRFGDEEKVEVIRKYVRSIDGFKTVNIIERETNDRVANSRGGLCELLEKYGRAIFLEEDIITAPGFLCFMNRALEVYANNDRIFSISGYSPPIKIPDNYRHDVYFLRRFNGWGFGTWKNRFDRIKYISQYEYERFKADKERVKEFVNGGGADMMRMLRKDACGEIDAGDVKAMYAQFLADQYTVYPVHSLVRNIGHDGTGVHCVNSNRFDVDLWEKVSGFVFVSNISPDNRIIKENLKFRNSYKNTVRRVAGRARRMGIRLYETLARYLAGKKY